jgi:hypothetical protein
VDDYWGRWDGMEMNVFFVHLIHLIKKRTTNGIVKLFWYVISNILIDIHILKTWNQFNELNFLKTFWNNCNQCL